MSAYWNSDRPWLYYVRAFSGGVVPDIRSWVGELDV